MPNDDWTRVTMSMCLENCPRFGPNGSIYDFTQSLVDTWSSKRTQWGGKAGEDYMIDPWVVPYRKITDNNSQGVTLRVAEFIGEQHIDYRDLDSDIKFGLFAKVALGFTDEEKHTLDRLLQCADVLYNPPTAFSGAAFATARGLANVGEIDEWGGYVLNGAFGAPAYGWGDIFMVMSLLSQADRGVSGLPESFKNMSYGETRDVLLKMWEGIKRFFPSLVTNDSTKVAVHRSVGKLTGTAAEDRNAMIATFRGLLERIKHPVWKTERATGNDTLTQAIQAYGGGGVNGSVFDSTEFKAAAPTDDTPATQATAATPAFTGLGLTAGFNKITSGIDGIDGVYATLEEYLTALYRDGADRYGDAANDAEQKEVLFEIVGLINGIVQLARVAQRTTGSIDDWRTRVKLTPQVLKGFREQGKDYGEKAYPEGAGLESGARGVVFTVTRWTFAPTAYGDNGATLNVGTEEFSPTDPYVPSRALLVQRTPAEMTFARARYGDGGQQFADAPIGIEVPRVHRQGDASMPYGDQRTAYVGASLAGEVGGPFLRMLPLGPEGMEGAEVAEREYMSLRYAYIKQHLGSDPIARLMAFCFILSEPTRQAFKAMAMHGLPIPMNFMLAAPFINIDTEAIVFAEGGSQTASTGMNLLDVNRAIDSDHKFWKVHATTHTGAKIIDPEKVLIIPDAKAAGYISGLELTFIKDHNDLKEYHLTRLDKAMFCMDVSPNFTRERATREASPMNLFEGRPNARTTPFNFERPETVFNKARPDFDSYFAYAAYFGFDGVNQHHTLADKTYRDLRESDWIPGTLWPTRVRTYNRQQGVFMQTERGQGHLDNIDLPMRDVLDGKIRYTDLHSRSHLN
jgi:hypothetical protein